MAFKYLFAGALNWHKTINDNNEETEIRIGSLERNLHNPNLLINTNFRVSKLINQRGQLLYNAQGYTVDMLKIEGSNVDFIMDLTGEFLKFTNKNETTKDNLTYTNISFKLENIFDSGNYTVSAKIRSQTGKRINLSAFIDDRWITSQHTFSSEDWEIVQLNVNFTDYIRSIVIQPQDSMVLELNYVKFEKGNIATPFVDDDPTTKLLKCQRYLQVLNNNKSSYMVIGNGLVRNNTKAYIEMETPIMRIANPNLTYSNINAFRLSAYRGGQSSYILPSSLTIQYSDATKGRVTIAADFVANTSLVSGEATNLQFYNVDNSQLLLSAEI